MAIAEGSLVAFAGWEAAQGPAIGDAGRVIASAGHGQSHVLFTTGKRKNKIDLLADEDLVVQRRARHSALDDSLSDGNLTALAVRRTYDSGGPVGLLDALNEEGGLASFGSIADEAMSLIASRIRHDPVIAVVLADLDEDEAADFVELATDTLVRDAFRRQD